MPAPPTSASYSAANSCLGKNVQTMRSMLAACKYFQTLVGGNESDALARIYHGSLPKPASNAETFPLSELQSYRPFAIIFPSPTTAINYNWEATGGLNWNHSRSGEIEILIERDHPSSGGDDVNDFGWTDLIGQIVHSGDSDNPGLLELHALGNHLQLARVSVLDIYRSDEEDWSETGDTQRAHIRVKWGLRF